jgi:17beta-estradiol 17-dehydrogenase / very-long-chain 3-oxoacyl-CoA reductase
LYHTQLLISILQLTRYAPKGCYAVITGASDGIGKEFALQLAKKGYNLLLISRTQSKLESLAAEIKKTYNGVDVSTFAMDFSQNNEADYALLAQLINTLDIGILINNVGLSHSIPVSFLETPDKEVKDIVTINVTGTLRITKLVAPKMIEKKRGLILTMASFGGVFPTPYLATYSGSKAFLQHWSVALASELAPHGVHAQVIQSHLVVSAMSKIRKTSFLVPSPKAFVRAALGKIGLRAGSQDIAYTCTPWWSHALMQWVINNLAPGGQMGSFVLGKNRVMHEQIRKRALRKAERDAKKQ